jgi:hypothetical protein
MGCTFEDGEAVGGAFGWDFALLVDDGEVEGDELKVVRFLLHGRTEI